MKRLDELGLSGATNIVVMSDQGVGHSAFGVNLNAELIRAGPKARDSDDVGIARSGQTQLIHLKNHDRTLFRRITEFLRAQGWAGVLFTAGSPAFDISLLLEALKRIQRMKQSQSHGVLKPRHNPQICRIECTGRRSLTLDDMVDRHEELAAVRWNGAVVGSPSNTQPASVNKLRAVAALRTNR